MRFLTLLAVAAVAVPSLDGCQKSNDATPALIGTWRLVDRQCYCAPGPLPNETAVFTANGFSFSKNGQPAFSGTYVSTAVTICAAATPAPGLQFAYTSAAIAAPQAAFTLEGNRLILDYGSPCDAVRNTYVRVP